MKKKIPSKTIEVCDLCGRESSGLFTECVVCEKDYCCICEGIIGGCIHMPDVCKECSRRDDVREVVDEFAGQLSPILEQRELALSDLPKKVEKP